MSDSSVDFDGAQNFLNVARDAYERGDDARFNAARKLIAVTLRIGEQPVMRFRTDHLKQPEEGAPPDASQCV